jgi:hypothetical protein
MAIAIIIGVAWMVILGPSLMKRRSRTVGEIGSISHFHRQLRVLEHSAPQPIVTPAYRLRTVDGTGDSGRWTSYPEVAAAPVLSVVGAKQLPRPALAFLGEEPVQPSADQPIPSRQPYGSDPGDGDRFRARGPTGVGIGAPSRMVDSDARHRVSRRRRDTLGVLAAVFVGTMMIGCVPGAGLAWVLAALSGVALIGYVTLLVHLRRMAEERERKLHYLRPEGIGGVDAGAVVDVPTYMSGRDAHPSNQAVAAR